MVTPLCCAISSTNELAGESTTLRILRAVLTLLCLPCMRTASGMYCFNWHQAARFNMVNGRYSLRGGRALMNEIGGMESLLHKDKVYPAAQRVVLTDGPWRGACCLLCV